MSVDSAHRKLAELMSAVSDDAESLFARLEATLHDPIAEGDLQELVTETAVVLIEYKGLARESFIAVEECRYLLSLFLLLNSSLFLGLVVNLTLLSCHLTTHRNEIQAKKKEVDERQLQLQNLLYEKDHLQRTIQSLRDYPMREVNKMEKEEGTSLLFGLGKGLIAVPDHRKNMDILRLEREGREAMHRDHLEAQNRRTVLAAEIAELRDALGNEIPGHIHELTSVCKTIQERMPKIQMAAPFGG